MHNDVSHPASNRNLVIAAGLVFLLWALNFVVLLFLHFDFERMGQFGDLFGASNALFSGIALILIGLTLYFQNKEQARQKRTSSETILNQMFLQFTDMYYRTIEGFDYDSRVGRACIDRFKSKILKLFEEPAFKQLDNLDKLRDASDCMGEAFSNIAYATGGYFKIIEFLFEMLDDSNTNAAKTNLGFLKAQFSENELILLLCYGLSSDGHGLLLKLKRNGMLEKIARKKLTYDALQEIFDYIKPMNEHQLTTLLCKLSNNAKT